MGARPREALELELSHIHFLLEQIPLWSLPADRETELAARYTRSQRVLEEVLATTAGWLPEAAGHEPVPVAPEQAAPRPEAVPSEAEDDARHHRVSFQAIPAPVRTPLMVRHPPVEIPACRTPPPTRRLTPAPWAGSHEFQARLGVLPEPTVEPTTYIAPEPEAVSTPALELAPEPDSTRAVEARSLAGTESAELTPDAGAATPAAHEAKPEMAPEVPSPSPREAPSSAGSEPAPTALGPEPETARPILVGIPLPRAWETAFTASAGEPASPPVPEPTGTGGADARASVVEPPRAEVGPSLPAQAPSPTPAAPAPEPTRPRAATARRQQSDRKAVEATSTWRSVWKPFLYESILWFIGAFFIVAGSFYWVAESWEGMTSDARALVVFGLSAVYACAFVGVGKLLGRRPALARAGPVLQTIGAAIAPLAALALYPLYPSAVAWAMPLALAWAVAGAWLATGPTRAYLPEGLRWMQALVFVATLGIGWAHAISGLAPALLSAEGLAVLMFLGMSGYAASARTEGHALAFLLGAPAYLIGIEAIRLQIGSTLPLTSQMPLAILLVAGLLAIRSGRTNVLEDPLAIGGLIPLQCGLALLALGGAAWSRLASLAAFAVSCALLSYRASFGSLEAGAVGASEGRAPKSFALVSGQAGRERDAALWELLGLSALLLAIATAGNSVGFHHLFGTLASAPAGGLGAWELWAALGLVTGVALWASHREAHDEARATLRLRWVTAVCVLLALFITATFRDQSTHPVRGLIAFGALSALTFGIGLWRERPGLVRAGSAIAVLWPWILDPLTGDTAVIWIAAVLALALAGLSALRRPAVRKGPSIAAFVLALLAFVPALLANTWPPVVIAAVALGWIAQRRRSAWQATVTGGLLAFAVLMIWESPLALGGLAAVAAALAWKGTHPAARQSKLPLVYGVDFDALLFSGIAIAWAWGVTPGEGGLHAVIGFALGPTLLLGAVTLFLLARRWKRLAHIGAVVFCAAALPPLGWGFVPWQHLPVAASFILLAGIGAAASVWSLTRGPSALARTFAVAAGIGLVGLVMGEPGALHALGWLAALGLLCGAPAIWTPGGLSAAALVALGWGLSHGGDARLLTAAVATGIALLDLRPSWRRRICGEQPLAEVASVCALGLLASACALPNALVLAGMVLLPLCWLEATGLEWVLAATPLLGGWASVNASRVSPFVVALVWTVLLTRALFHVRAARQRLLREKAEESKDRLPREILLGAAVVGALATLAAVPRLSWPVAALLCAAPLLVATESLPVRLVLAAFAVTVVPSGLGTPGEARIFWEAAIGVYLLVGFAARFAPEATHRLLGAKPRQWTQTVAALSALGMCAFAFAVSLSLPFCIQLAAVLVPCALLLGFPEVWIPSGAVLIYGLLAELSGGTPLVDSIAVVLALSAAALALRSMRLRAPLEAVAERVHPGARTSWPDSTWLGALLGWLMVTYVAALSFGRPSAVDGVALLVAAVVLTWAERPYRVWIGAALVGAASGLLLMPGPWAPALASTAALALALASRLRRGEAKRWQLDAASVLVWLPLFALRSPADASLPVCVGAVMATCWLRVFWVGDGGLISAVQRLFETPDAKALPPVPKGTGELFAWIITLLGGHALLVYVGTVLSTGKPAAFILPDFGAVSAVIAALAMWRLRAPKDGAPPEGLGRALAGVALFEVAAGVWLLPRPAPAPAVISALTVAGLSAVLVWETRRKGHASAAWSAVAAWVLCGLSLRLDGVSWGVGPLDAFAPVVLGSAAAFLGRRLSHAEGWKPFGSPLRLLGYLLPIAGCAAAVPLRSSGGWMAACALLACAAHFSAISRWPEDRLAGSLLAALAFNGALLVVWSHGTWTAPELFLVPTGLTALALLRRFKATLDPTVHARLRALAIAGIYGVAAFRPLMLPTTWDFLLCLVVCLLGVVAGVMLRVRSYVYLGTTFLVTAVVANLVRYGVRDHRLAAVFLSVLGLMVLSSMVLFTAKRAELVARWERMRALLARWEA